MKTISKLANEFGVKPDTIRYYERIGLLPEPTRTRSNYRLYDKSAGERLSFIKGSQRLGLRLEEIKELLEIRDTGLCPCGHTGALLRRRVADIDEELQHLTALRAQLASMVEALPEQEKSDTRKWHCADELIPVGSGLAEWLCPEPGGCASPPQSLSTNQLKEVNHG